MKKMMVPARPSKSMTTGAVTWLRPEERYVCPLCTADKGKVSPIGFNINGCRMCRAWRHRRDAHLREMIFDAIDAADAPGATADQKVFARMARKVYEESQERIMRALYEREVNGV